jgi:putative addiction module killer protein/probable addiction module antidote protein
VAPVEILLFRKGGSTPFSEWLASLRDVRAVAIVRARLNRIRLGNFGDCKSVGGGVEELRIDVGRGYRIYYGRDGALVVILICGGDKGLKPEISSKRRNIGRSIWMAKPAAKTESYRENLLKSLKDPDEAAYYLNACLEDADARVFLLALRDVADARGGVRAVSQEARLNRESLYRMLSKSGNPSLDSLAAVLNACGLRLSVQSTGSRRGRPGLRRKTRQDFKS